MAYRYTNTDKWNDAWYLDLKPMEKLLFNYLCDNCDIAGFIEVSTKKWASDIGTDKRTIEGALKGLQRGLIFSKWTDCIYLKHFLRHQKNLPLNPEKNPAHRGIIKRFELYQLKFDIGNIDQFITEAETGIPSDSEGASKPLGRGLGNGNGKGIGIGIGKKEEKESEKREEEFEIFRKAYPGTKRGHDTELAHFQKNHKDWKEIIPILMDRLNSQIDQRAEKEKARNFIPQWKNLKTYLYQRSWEEEFHLDKYVPKIGFNSEPEVANPYYKPKKDGN
jgi:hypothetical protein